MGVPFAWRIVAGEVGLTQMGWRGSWAEVNEWKPWKEVGDVEGSQGRSMMCWALENKCWQQQRVSGWVGVFFWVEVNIVLA